jgi:hypothetical protein
MSHNKSLRSVRDTFETGMTLGWGEIVTSRRSVQLAILSPKPVRTPISQPTAIRYWGCEVLTDSRTISSWIVVTIDGKLESRIVAHPVYPHNSVEIRASIGVDVMPKSPSGGKAWFGAGSTELGQPGGSTSRPTAVSIVRKANAFSSRERIFTLDPVCCLEHYLPFQFNQHSLTWQFVTSIRLHQTTPVASPSAVNFLDT